MRSAILALSSAALVACGGATASTTADVIDASPGDGSGGDASGYDGASSDAAADASADASDGDTGPGDADSDGGAFACGTSSCTAPDQYCQATITGSMCMPVPFGCPSAMPTCACVEGIDGGFPGCTCQDPQGQVTITCR